MNSILLEPTLRVNSPILFVFSCFFMLPLFSLSAQDCNQNIYRSIDGSCNNISNEITRIWGAAHTPLLRELPAKYSQEDSLNGMIFPTRPNPRAVSNLIFNQNNDIGNPNNLSSLTYTWGQFLDHDITLVEGAKAESITIPLPDDEPLFTQPISFTRSTFVDSTGINSARNQANGITAWIDASMVYGSDEHRANWLRTFINGKLKTSAGNLLPYNTINGEKDGLIDNLAPAMDGIHNGQTIHFVAGDFRANEQPGLTTLHTLFVREHNRICEDLLLEGYQDDEEIYQLARKKVGALIQAITYQEFLPALNIDLTTYSTYDPNIQPDIMNLFATAAYRIGHTMVGGSIPVLDENCSPIRDKLKLEEAFFNNKWIEDLGVEPLLRGLLSQQQETIDAKVVDGLRNFLFSIPQVPGSFGLDLVTLNIQRGRDHGLPDYNTVRAHFLGAKATSFEQINSDTLIANRLAALYNNDIDNIDLWVGLLTEEKKQNGSMGPTIEQILKVQFDRLRIGDYYYYENDPFYDLAEKENIKNTSLANIIHRNTNISTMPSNVFYAEDCKVEIADCDAIKVEGLEGQIEITNLNAPFVVVKVFDKDNGWQRVAQCYGEDCDQAQIFDLPQGNYWVNVEFYNGFWSDFICRTDFSVKVKGNAPVFSCDSLLITSTNDAISVTGLTAPFSTIKIFDKNAAWSVVASCTDCSENSVFNLPAGDYFMQLDAYDGYWRNLICERDMSISVEDSIGGGLNCDALNVSAEDGGIRIAGLTAPFSTVKVFDINQGWSVVANCYGTDCAENQFFNLPPSRYNVEIALYNGYWSDMACKEYFPIELNGNAANRNGNQVQAKIFPNPVENFFFVDLKKYKGKTAQLQLINQYGQILKKIEHSTLPAELLKISTSDLVNGWYYLHINIENEVPKAHKIAVNRLY